MPGSRTVAHMILWSESVRDCMCTVTLGTSLRCDCRVVMQSRRFLYLDRLPSDIRENYLLGTGNIVLTRTSLLSRANRKGEIPLLLLTRVSPHRPQLLYNLPLLFVH